jgi:hypothetical protein
MSHKFLILLFVGLCAEAAQTAGALPPRTVQEKIQELLTPPPPRTVDQKVNDADRIVGGEVILLGEGKPILHYGPRHDCAWMGLGNDPLPEDPDLPDDLYERKVQVAVTEVLWPAALKGITNIVFEDYMFKKKLPRWAYTNTAGIFFLTREASPSHGEWTKLERYDDWIESTNSAQSVQAVITKIKADGSRPISQPDGPANGSQPIRSEINSTSGPAGSRR